MLYFLSLQSFLKEVPAGPENEAFGTGALKFEKS